MGLFYVEERLATLESLANVPPLSPYAFFLRMRADTFRHRNCPRACVFREKEEGTLGTLAVSFYRSDASTKFVILFKYLC